MRSVRSQHVGRDERVAVAVAADPRADAQERRQLGRGLPPGAAAAARPRARRTARGTSGRNVCSKNERPFATSSSTSSFSSRSMRVCHSASTARRIDSSLAASSCGVSRVRSRACSSRSSCISRSRTLLRCTSVGCAVSTGTTSAVAEEAGQRVAASMPAAAIRSSARARLPSAGGSPAMSACRRRRLWCRSSARLARCEK